MLNEAVVSPRVLLIGLAPEAVDLTDAPIDEETLRARIVAGDAAIVAAGYDAVSCLLGTDPVEGEADVRARLSDGVWDAVMIGAGIRGLVVHTELFERIVNAVHELAPGARFAFNTGPDATLDALTRALGRVS